MDLDLLPESRAALAVCGWSEHRSVDVSLTVQRLSAAGYVLDDYMVRALASLSGLKIDPVVSEGVGFRNDDPLVVDPVGAGVRHLAEAKDLEEWFRSAFCPLGWWLCRSHVFFSSSGLVVASAPGVVWHMGDSLSEALNFALLGNGPLVRLWSMDGME